MTLVSDPDVMQAGNPDDDLTIYQVIMKYQMDYTKYFGPNYAFGVRDVTYISADDQIEVIARVYPVHQPTRGMRTTFKVPMHKFEVWRNNIKLYKFIGEATNV